MKRKIPTQLILLAALAALAVTGWIYIYSCRDKVIMELQTITGDASCLSDKELNIRCTPSWTSLFPNTESLDIGFASGPALENITYENVTETFLRHQIFWLSGPYQSNGQIGFTVDMPIGYEESTVFVPGLEFKDESAMIPDEYYLKHPHNKATNVRSDISNFKLIEMDGIVYFSLSSYYQLLTYRSSYEWIDADGTTQTEYYDLTYPVEFKAQSGIWAVDASSGASPENIVPFSITSNPDDPKVFGIYEVEAESAIVLLTIEDHTDLYATVYDTKTKTTHDPVLIFHSDSGDIDPTISRENDTCPMGSIIVEVQNDDKDCYAVALGKNELNGNVEPVCYDFEQIKPTTFIGSFSEKRDYDGSDDYDYSEIFYRGEEMWISSYIRPERYGSSAPFSLDNPIFPYSSQADFQVCMIGVKEGAIFYEGLLSIDLTFADIEAYAYQNASNDSFGSAWSGIVARIELH